MLYSVVADVDVAYPRQVLLFEAKLVHAPCTSVELVKYGTLVIDEE